MAAGLRQAAEARNIQTQAGGVPPPRGRQKLRGGRRPRRRQEEKSRQAGRQVVIQARGKSEAGAGRGRPEW